MKLLEELKARKAKFGFKCDYVGLSAIIPLGRLLEWLNSNCASDQYTVEMVGMHQNDFRLYTNDETVANSVRILWATDKPELQPLCKLP